MTSYSLQTIQQCPVCGSAQYSFDSVSLPNLYSEKLAELLGVKESELLENYPNYRCEVCDLVYKRSWFSTDLLSRLFNEVVPDHPKGWDAVSGRYTFANFYKELAVYEQALHDSDTPTINRYRRALTSMIECIPDHDLDSRLLLLKMALDTGKTEVFHVQDVKDALSIGMQSVIPFKRFEGFGSPLLWEYLTQKVGPITQYAEIVRNARDYWFHEIPMRWYSRPSFGKQFLMVPDVVRAMIDTGRHMRYPEPFGPAQVLVKALKLGGKIARGE